MPDEKKRWWEIEGWREREAAKAAQIASNPTVISGMDLTYFNPTCKHERCAYDLATCEKCIEYSKQKNLEHAKQTTKTSSS